MAGRRWGGGGQATGGRLGMEGTARGGAEGGGEGGGRAAGGTTARAKPSVGAGTQLGGRGEKVGDPAPTDHHTQTVTRPRREEFKPDSDPQTQRQSTVTPLTHLTPSLGGVGTRGWVEDPQHVYQSWPPEKQALVCPRRRDETIDRFVYLNRYVCVSSEYIVTGPGDK